MATGGGGREGGREWGEREKGRERDYVRWEGEMRARIGKDTQLFGVFWTNIFKKHFEIQP